MWSDPNHNKKLMKENVVRMFYAEMLGHDAEFGHIHAVTLSSHTDLLWKWTGYLASWLTVSPENEKMYLIVASMQKDMKSAAYLEVSCALTAAAKLIQSIDVMAAVNPELTGTLMAHPQALVRKKVAIAMLSFYRKSEGSIGNPSDFRKLLCDKDPAVMMNSLNIIYELAKENPQSQQDLLPSLLEILKQIMEHRLSRDYDYHRVPAPWMQIRLLKIIALIADSPEDTAKCEDVLLEVLRRADTGLNIGHAVVYECISTITALDPIPSLIAACAEQCTKFLTSTNANIKYIGITALSKIVKIDSSHARQHQGIVLQCLEDNDDTIRRKTLSLLYAMCNEDNVEAICLRLVKFLADSTDKYQREDIVKNICNIADMFKTSNEWYIETLNRVLEIAPEHMSPLTVQAMLKQIAEGDGDDEQEDAEFRTKCVEDYFSMGENPDKKLSEKLIQVMAWVIGEYGFLTQKLSRPMLIDRLSDLMERTTDATSRGWIVTAMMKLTAHSPAPAESVVEVVEKLKNSRSVALQQRSYEFYKLMSIMPILKQVCPLDGCCEEIEVDETLSFLNPITERALQDGARPYKKKTEVKAEKTHELLTKEYIRPGENNTAPDTNSDEDEPDLRLPGRKPPQVKWGVDDKEEEPDNAVQELFENDEKGAPVVAEEVPTTMLPKEKLRKHGNEKFINDIFSESDKKQKKRKFTRGGGSETAKKALKRILEEPGMTAQPETQHETPVMRPNLIDASTPSLGAGPSKPQTPPSGTAIEVNISKKLDADSVLYRVGGRCTAGDVARVLIAAKPPAHCMMQMNTFGDLGTVQPGVGVKISKMNRNEPVYALVKLGASDYPAGGGLQVEITGADPSQLDVRNFRGVGQISLEMADILRPIKVTPDAFMQQWDACAQFAAEGKISGTPTVEQINARLNQRLNLSILGVNDSKAMVAGKVIPCGKPVMIICEVQPGNNCVIIFARSQGNKDFSRALVAIMCN